MANNDQTIQDAEIVDDSTSDTQLLLNLSEMITNNMNLIENTKKELTEQRSMLNDTLANDSTYIEQQEEVKKASKLRNATKAEILKRPSVSQIAERVKSLSSQVREYSAALSDYLREYSRVSGENTFDAGGEVLEIIYVAKLRRVNRGRK